MKEKGPICFVAKLIGKTNIKRNTETITQPQIRYFKNNGTRVSK